MFPVIPQIAHFVLILTNWIYHSLFQLPKYGYVMYNMSQFNNRRAILAVRFFNAIECLAEMRRLGNKFHVIGHLTDLALKILREDDHMVRDARDNERTGLISMTQAFSENWEAENIVEKDAKERAIVNRLTE